MERLVYLSVRVGCAAYLLYKVWEQKKKVRELCDLLYTPAKREQMISMSPEPADEKEVMGKTRFVYLDENAGKTAAPYMSQPLEQGTDYIGEDEEIREEDVECLLPLEEMELLRKEQEELDSANGSDYAGGYAGGVQPCRGCADEGERGGSECGQKKQCRTDAVRYPQYQSVRSFHFPGRE